MGRGRGWRTGIESEGLAVEVKGGDVADGAMRVLFHTLLYFPFQM